MGSKSLETCQIVSNYTRDFEINLALDKKVVRGLVKAEAEKNKEKIPQATLQGAFAHDPVKQGQPSQAPSEQKTVDQAEK